MRTINLFKKPKKKGPVEYSDLIMRAVCDRRITGLKINCNYGFDYIDQKYHYLRLLIVRGQVSVIKTGQDLLASDSYLYALAEGNSKQSPGNSTQVIFESRTLPTTEDQILPTQPKLCSFASSKRIEKAKQRFNEFFNKKQGA